jgi:ubiquinone biosynthesis protein
LGLLKIAKIEKTYRHVKRYRQVLGVLFEYGFGDLVDALNIEHYLEIGLQLVTREPQEKIEHLSQAERFREALEKLGPTFIKLGQILANRQDLMPADFIKELGYLHDRVPAFSVAEARQLIEEEFEAPVDSLFMEFGAIPIAAASIGQVHSATLSNGQLVAVKVQRPDIRDIISVDLEIMYTLAGMLEEHVDELKMFYPTQVINEFAEAISHELDYNLEAASIERFSRQFADEEFIYVPKVFYDTTSSRVLTMEYIDGIKISELEVLEKNNLDRKTLAFRGFDLMMKQIFDHGFFHADPHPGNIFALPENRICFIDFGTMGRISIRHRELFAELLEGISTRDETAVTAAILKIANYDSFDEHQKISQDIARFMDMFCYKPLKKIDLEGVSREILKLSHKHSLKVPPELFLMIKALTIAEGIGCLLDPDFNLVKNAEPFIKKMKLAKLDPRKLMRDLTSSSGEFIHLLKDIPGELRVILKMAREGKVKIEFEHKGLEPMLNTYDRIGNLICYAIVTAALIIGSSLIVLSGIPPVYYNVPLIGLVGFLVAGAMGFKLLFSIIRGRKM